MTDSLNEQLSACLDGQLPEAELDLLLKRMERDSELRLTMGRYSLVGEAMRGHGAARATADFADRVSAAIAAEEPLNGNATRARGAVRSPQVLRWLRPLAGAAVAAGVAAVAVFMFQTEAPPVAQVAEQSTSTVSAPDSYIVPASTATGFMPATRLTNYVVAHSEYSSPLGRRAVLSGVLAEEDETATSDGAGRDVEAGEESLRQREQSEAAASPSR
jgi:sigma-E factor negative regulatory protein RseA